MDKLRPFEKAMITVISLVVAAIMAILGFWEALNPVIAILGALIAFLIFVGAAFSILYQAAKVTDEFENTRPKLKVKPFIEQHPLYVLVPGLTLTSSKLGTLSGKVPMKSSDSYFALAHFSNEPIEPTETSVAKDVSATITYYDKNGKARINDGGIPGRWWSQNEVIEDENPREKEKVDIPPNTQGEILALACMGTKESAIFAYNNKSHESKDYKKSEFSLGLGSYHIRVRLSGVHLKPVDYWFYIWRDSSSGELKIKSEKKPNLQL